MSFPTPTIVYRRRHSDWSSPTIHARPQRAAIIAATAGTLVPRCEDCLTTTITRTNYVDEYGQSTTCTTTQYQTTYQTTTLPLHTTPTPTSIPVPVASPVETVYHTMTSTIPSNGYNDYPSQSSGHSSDLPFSSKESGMGNICDCGQQWAKVFLGGIPHGAAEVMASLAFFFPFLLFFLVALIRLKTYSGDKEMFFFLLPLTLFLAIMLSAMATRAYSANNDSLPHYLAQYVMTALAVPLLMEVALQLYGLLSKRGLPSGWIDATSLFLRFINVVALILYSVAAGSFVSFVNNLELGQADCSSSPMTKILVLNIVGNILELLILIICCVCLFLARWRLRMETSVLIIQYLINVALAFHFVWRFLHDVNAANAWRNRVDAVCGASLSSTVLYHDPAAITWSSLREVANNGMNGAATFWLLGILPIFAVATLLMAANLCRYVSAVPEPNPEADSVRYKLCYNENTKKMEFQRLDNPGGPLLPSGEQLYELVRDHDGDGWAIREARISTVQPSWEMVTFSPWYK